MQKFGHETRRFPAVSESWPTTGPKSTAGCGPGILKLICAYFGRCVNAGISCAAYTSYYSRWPALGQVSHKCGL